MTSSLPNEEMMLPESRTELERGLRFAHVMMSVNQDQGNEAVAYVQALTDLLVEKGIIQPDEMEAPLERAREEVSKVMMPRVRLAEMGDKYFPGESIQIDCDARIPLCHARCCTFKFYLTKQDLEEGVARWDYGNPYWIDQRTDGYCVHCAPESKACQIHAQRPHTCRKYDCRNDKRVWIDFEKRIPAPMPAADGNAPIAMAEVALQNSSHSEHEPPSDQLGFDSAKGT